MKSCKRYRPLFSSYIENVLRGSERTGLENHLDHCRACRSVVRAMTKMKHMMAGLPPVKAGENFTIVLRERIRREMYAPQRSDFSMSFFKRYVPAFGLGLFVALAAVWGFNRAETENPVLAGREADTEQAEAFQTDYVLESTGGGVSLSRRDGQGISRDTLVPPPRGVDNSIIHVSF